MSGAPGSVVNGPFVPGVKGPAVRDAFATSASAIDVEMKMAAKITVVRVNAFAAPRPVIKPPAPPPVPRPRPPPSDRCNRMTPIIEMHTTIWMVRRIGNRADIGLARQIAGRKFALKKPRVVAEWALDGHP